MLLLAAALIAFGILADQALPSTDAPAYGGADLELIPAWLHIQAILDLGESQ